MESKDDFKWFGEGFDGFVAHAAGVLDEHDVDGAALQGGDVGVAGVEGDELHFAGEATALDGLHGAQ